MRHRVVGMIGLAAAAVLALGAGGASSGQVNLGLSVSDGRLSSFYLAVGEHYHVAPGLVADFGTRYRLGDEELPVVFFLAARARVAPRAVIDLRRGRRSWFEIALHFGLSPEIFFVPVGTERIGPPYGRAYGYYRKHGRAGDWRKFSPSDREVLDLVNLRFLSEYHGVGPERIIGWRGQGRNFVAIHEEARRAKGKDKGDQPGKPRGNRPPKNNRK